jgi:uncharacterized membrane protein YwaF
MIYWIIMEGIGLVVGLMVCLTLVGDLVSASSNLAAFARILLFILTLCAAYWVGSPLGTVVKLRNPCHILGGAL